MSLEPGAILSHYRIVSSLGAGGMGEVYRARDSQLDRDVALKILPAEQTADPERRNRFLQEARAASALSHPNVAHIYEIGEAGGVHFIAMEYVEGQTLAAKVGGRPLPSQEIVDIAAQAADALDAAQAKGIVHRDIKSANIMIAPRGQVKVLDFGLAKMSRGSTPAGGSELATEVVTRQGVVLGTIQYMSPEQVLGRETDARSDLFSLGVVLYEMATGRLPFTGPTSTETMHRITQAQPEAIARLNYEIPPELERIIRKCLEKDRERRYQSARELVVDLRNLQRDSTSGTAPVAIPRRRFPYVAAAAVALVALAAAAFFLLRGRGSSIESIAVLPFVNAANDPNLEYVSDGITEDLINSLSQAPKLKVTARATVFSYKGKPLDPRKIGRELSVRAVLMGRVVRRGDQISVQADLVDVADGSELWGQQYGRAATELQAIQGDIAQQITDHLRVKLSGEEAKRLAQPAVDPQTYDLCLQGRHALSERTEDRIRKSLVFFQQAIERSPNYAPAYAGLANTHAYLDLLEMSPPQESMPLAKAAALKALQLDPALAEAHTPLGIVKALYDWDWPGAEREFRQTPGVNASEGYDRHWYAHWLEIMGRRSEALPEMQKALQLDPLNPMLVSDVGGDLLLNGRYEEAILQERKALQLDADDPNIHMMLAVALEGKGMRAESLAETDRAMALVPFPTYVAGTAAGVYCRAGKRDAARNLLSKLDALAKKQYISPFERAMVHVALGDKQQGLELLVKAVDERSANLPFVVFDPVIDPLRSDPQFAAAMTKIGLPQAAWSVRTGAAK